MTRIRILLADDHTVLREGLAALIDTQDDMLVVAQAGDGNEAIEQARHHEPDVAIIDLGMPNRSGLDALSQIREACPEVRLLVLTMHDEAEYLRSAIQRGVSGYVVKQTASSELLTAVREVYAGRDYIRVSLEGGGLKSMVESEKNGAGADRRNQLSEREQQVLELLAYGYTNKEISAKLELAKQTVDTYRTRIQDKLGIQGRAAMVRYALKAGILSPENG